jgi:hypothetical protein
MTRTSSQTIPQRRCLTASPKSLWRQWPTPLRIASTSRAESCPQTVTLALEAGTHRYMANPVRTGTSKSNTGQTLRNRKAICPSGFSAVVTSNAQQNKNLWSPMPPPISASRQEKMQRRNQSRGFCKKLCRMGRVKGVLVRVGGSFNTRRGW